MGRGFINRLLSLFILGAFFNGQTLPAANTISARSVQGMAGGGLTKIPITINTNLGIELTGLSFLVSVFPNPNDTASYLTNGPKLDFTIHGSFPGLLMFYQHNQTNLSGSAALRVLWSNYSNRVIYATQIFGYVQVAIPLNASVGNTYSIRIEESQAESNYLPPGPDAILTVIANSPPGAPSDLTASADSHDQITLSWKNNSIYADGIYIERKPSADTLNSFHEIADLQTYFPINSYQDASFDLAAYFGQIGHLFRSCRPPLGA